MKNLVCCRLFYLNKIFHKSMKKILNIDGVTVGIVFFSFNSCIYDYSTKGIPEFSCLHEFCNCATTTNNCPWDHISRSCRRNGSSFPSTVALSSYIFANLFENYQLSWLALAISILAGATVGLVNGLLQCLEYHH